MPIVPLKVPRVSGDVALYHLVFMQCKREVYIYMAGFWVEL